MMWLQLCCRRAGGQSSLLIKVQNLGGKHIHAIIWIDMQATSQSHKAAMHSYAGAHQGRPMKPHCWPCC